MAVCNTWVYYGVDDQKWEKIKQLMKEKYNIEITGKEGETKIAGVMVHYKYHPDSQIGEMTVISKPILFPCATIKKIIDNVFYSIDNES